MKRSILFPSVVAVTFAVMVTAGSAVALAQTAPATQPDLTGPCPVLDPSVPTGGGGAHNMVIVHNPSGGDLVARGSVQLNHIPGPDVGPVNCAAALNGTPASLDLGIITFACTGCKSLAVALQIDLIGRNVTRAVPRNIANAQNVRCQQCAAVAIAIQYELQVDDPTQVPPDADALARSMDQELRQLQTQHAMTASDAADQVIAVLNQFASLAASLDLQRSDAV